LISAIILIVFCAKAENIELDPSLLSFSDN
jgi:hypothetical protein